MKKYFASLFIFLFLHVSCINMYGQNNGLLAFEPFFRTQVPAYQNWLINTGMAEVLKVDTINSLKTQPKLVKLYLNTPGLGTWERLEQKFDSLYQTNLSLILINKLVFLMDIPDSCGKIVINAGTHLIQISYSGEGLRKIVSRKMGTITTLEVPIGELKNIHVGSATKSTPVNIIKTELKNGLKTYFNKFKQESWFYTFQFRERPGKDNELNIDIYNVKNIVLNNGAFEFIQLRFTFTPGIDVVHITYNLDCKYAMGLLWAPHESRYEPIDNLASSQFSYFDKDFYKMIINILGL